MSKQRDLLDKLLKPFLSRRHQDRAARRDDLDSIAAREHKVFQYAALLSATRKFSDENKLGEGGFGAVYKGILRDGRVVAVKRLSARSRQGDKEFKNEALLLSRVQHRNIVNLYGYCANGGGDGAQPEKLLVYEYIPRESLDRMLFVAEKRCQLDWTKRFDIINGVARGLLYLHEDCHTSIIHRDIKASNILLDERWTPKIADFGMARLYPENQTHVQTRVAGTNGYMAPEYLMHGHLSTKADVFSFGVLVLELISGLKSSMFYAHSDADSLLEWVWKLYRKGRSMEILDSVLKGRASEDQVTTCIHIGLLCSQADPKFRPDMKRVVVMLSKKTSSLPEPTRPGFPSSRYQRSHVSRRTSSSAETASSQFQRSHGSGRTSSSAETASSLASTSGSKSSYISKTISNPVPSSNAMKSPVASYRGRHVSKRSR